MSIVSLIILLAGLGVWEIAADRRLLGDARTMSEYIWAFEDRFGWPAYLIVAIVAATLFAHLVFRWPYGPSA